MFRFDFNLDNSSEEFSSEQNDIGKLHDVNIKSMESEEIQIQNEHFENIKFHALNSTNLAADLTDILYVKSGNVLKTCSMDREVDLKKAEIMHSDLIPGVYEGGAKLWECTEDLIRYLAKNFTSNDFKDKTILDLGCGCGLLGIYALKYGGLVHFQDYNKDVLNTITIPNILINFPDVDANDRKFENVKLYSGDWEKYLDFTNINGIKFDYIFTSETIYNPENYYKLLRLFKSKLKSNGIILLAAKTYYFGVGGGLRQFENELNKDEQFESEIVWKSSGNGVCREILKIQLKN